MRIPADTRARWALIGPLNLHQILALGTGGLLAWMAWKTGLPESWRGAFVAGFLLAGAGVAFGRFEGENVPHWVRAAVGFWLRRRRLPHGETGRLLDLQELRDGVLFTGNRGAVLVLRVSSLNLDLCTLEEKERILHGYGEFLNALSFPVQVVTVTQALHMDAYLQGLRDCEQQEDRRLGESAGAYRRFVERLLAEQSLFTRCHYLCAPWYPPAAASFPGTAAGLHEAALQQLRLRRRSLEEGLSNLGLKAQVLTEQELLTFFLRAWGEEGTIAAPTRSYLKPVVRGAGEVRRGGGVEA
ncbi:MAG: hypothetical protein M0Z27_06945 [Thermaerobacter sp.]|jgi:hypothetical protein|nr:hypothetical protein [Thermaerobacter sp.]MDA8145779.1 hypothetical protein [Thermaerobacter sp.]